MAVGRRDRRCGLGIGGDADDGRRPGPVVVGVDAGGQGFRSRVVGPLPAGGGRWPRGDGVIGQDNGEPGYQVGPPEGVVRAE